MSEFVDLEPLRQLREALPECDSTEGIADIHRQLAGRMSVRVITARQACSIAGEMEALRGSATALAKQFQGSKRGKAYTRLANDAAKWATERAASPYVAEIAELVRLHKRDVRLLQRLANHSPESSVKLARSVDASETKAMRSLQRLELFSVAHSANDGQTYQITDFGKVIAKLLL